MKKALLNFDANATFGPTPGLAEVLRALPEGLLNPSSIHSGGQRARAVIEDARDSVAELLNCKGTARVVFTSGATEANGAAVTAPYWGSINSQCCGEIATTTIEHPSVLGNAARLAEHGVSHSLIPYSAENDGWLNLESHISKNTKFISCMLANNETGQILPVKEIAKKARALNPKIIVHTDAVQAFGKIPVDWKDLGVDLMSISAHKIGGLAGVGALVLGKHSEIEPLILGGPQEAKLRGGTENVVGIYSFGMAARTLLNDSKNRWQKMASHTELIRAELSRNISNVSFTLGDQVKLSNTLSVRIAGVLADDLVVALDLEGVAISSGAACSSGKPDPSHVLLAMGLTESAARETIRISLTGENTEADVLEGVKRIVLCVDRIRTNREIINKEHREHAALS